MKLLADIHDADSFSFQGEALTLNEAFSLFCNKCCHECYYPADLKKVVYYPYEGGIPIVVTKEAKKRLRQQLQSRQQTQQLLLEGLAAKLKAQATPTN